MWIGQLAKKNIASYFLYSTGEEECKKLTRLAKKSGFRATQKATVNTFEEGLDSFPRFVTGKGHITLDVRDCKFHVAL